MAEFVLEDAREYVIPIFTVRGEGEGVYLESRVFLGTAFFVTKRGDAITAGHVIRGSPLFVGTKVAGYLTGTVRSEETEETTEEVEEVSDKKEIIRITESRRIIHYGLTYPFSRLKDIRDPVLDNKTLFDFITQQNHEP